ncbi:MoaD/ThiS family protein [Natrinema sp. H-ect4]|uniref:MoaD/ThiS family protein n=1 Tax=Natrinema sp. H-ect4 TaxID=3242699 RepID=UPI0035A89B6E
MYKDSPIEWPTVQLECVFFGPFRDAVGEKTVFYETDAETVGELLVELEAAYPLEGELVADDGEGLAGDTVVTRDTKNVVHIDGLETELAADSVIRLVPSVYGG